MKYYENKKNINPVIMEGHYSYKLLSNKNGCVSGCCSGVSVYTSNDYPPPGVHEDQEGFMVIEGTGWARIGNEEFRVEPEVSFIAPAGVKHSIKKDSESAPIKVFWFHAAI